MHFESYVSDLSQDRGLHMDDLIVEIVECKINGINKMKGGRSMLKVIKIK